ncbi:MAG TPA: peptide ABC transporter substrate-binding protein, partial [Gemmatimonadaceae bacterium]|nr:peptide ABC transporter substrate-binding protein [Gemmatimonadaceae bacterium]
DSLSIAFSIDPRARWHDGTPVTAADVRYSVKAFTDTAIGSSAASSLTNIDSVQVKDSLTAVVWFKRHTPEQFFDLAYQVYILPGHVYDSIPVAALRTSEAATHPIGSGRFRFSKWEHGVEFEVLADTANYRGRPKLDRVVIVRADPAAAVAQVLSGQADLMDNFPIDQSAKLDGNPYARAVVVPTFGYGFLGFNLHAPKSKTAPHPVFGDVRVRRAVSMAVDRAAMVENVFAGRGKLSHGPFPMSVPFADSTLRLPPYDTTAARALLDSAGWRAGSDGMRAKNGRPLHFTIMVSSASVVRQRYAVLIQEQLRKVGMQVDIEQLDFNKFVPRYQTSDFDAMLSAFSADPTPAGFQQSWGTSGLGQQNVVGYSNTRVDAMFDSAGLAFDPSKERRYMSAAFQQIVDDAPAVWLYDLSTIDAVNRRFTTAPPRPDGWWVDLADWSIPADKRLDRDRIGLTPAKR